MMITGRLSATWHLGLVLQLILMLAVCPGFAKLRFTTSSFDEVHFGQPFDISWDGIDVDTSLIIFLMSDLDAETVDISFNIGGDATSPGQREFVWTPDEQDFGGEVLEDPSFQFYIELVGVDGNGHPNTTVAYVKSPNFTIHPRNATTSASPTSSALPTSITSSALAPTSTHTDGPLPPPNGELSTPMKIGIGIGAALLGLALTTFAGWIYHLFARKKQNGNASGIGATYIISSNQPLPAATIANAVPEIPENPLSPNDYTSRRWRPYSVPPNFNTQGTPYGPDAVGAPPAYMPQRAETMPSIHVVSEPDGRTMSAGPEGVSHADIPASLVPGSLQHRPASCPEGLPYPA